MRVETGRNGQDEREGQAPCGSIAVSYARSPAQSTLGEQRWATKWLANLRLDYFPKNSLALVQM